MKNLWKSAEELIAAIEHARARRFARGNLSIRYGNFDSPRTEKFDVQERLETLYRRFNPPTDTKEKVSSSEKVS